MHQQGMEAHRKTCLVIPSQPCHRKIPCRHAGEHRGGGRGSGAGAAGAPCAPGRPGQARGRRLHAGRARRRDAAQPGRVSRKEGRSLGRLVVGCIADSEPGLANLFNGGCVKACVCTASAGYEHRVHASSVWGVALLRVSYGEPQQQCVMLRI